MYIYVVGNIQSFFSVLTGIQMLFNPANNTLWASQGTNASGFPGSWALGLGLMFGFIIMILTGMNNLRIEFHKMMIIMIVFMALWEVQTSATVENMLTGNSVTVQGIPIGIVYPAAIFSTIAHDAAEEIGQADQTAGNNNPSLFTGSYNSNYGFAGPLALTYKLRGLYSVFNDYDSPLSGSVAQYVDHCIIPQASVVDSGELIDSPDLAATLFTGPNAIAPSNNQVPIDVNGSNQATAWQSVPCSTAQSTLSNAWSTFFGGTGSNSLNNVVSMKTQSNGKTGVDASTAESVLQTMFTTTANGGQNFIGNLILNCAAEAGNAQAASDMSSSADVTDPSTLSPYCTTKAAALGRQQAMNAGSASLFESNMIPTMALLQFLFFAMAPLTLIIAAMMGAQGLPMLGKYMIFGAWTESWIPVAQIINDYIQQTTNQLYANIQTAAAATSISTPGGGTMTMSATSSANIPMILTHAMNALSMADMMMASTPIITLVLLTGSYFALTQLGGKISGNDVVDKNMSESTPTDGTNVMQSGAYGVGMANTGNVGGAMGTGLAANTVSYGFANSASSGLSSIEQSNAAVTRQAAAQALETAAAVNTLTQKGEAGISSTNGYSSGAGIAYKEMNSAKQELATSFKVSQDDATKFGTAIGLGLGKNAEGKYTAKSIGALASLLKVNINGEQTAAITNAVNSGAVDSAMHSLASGIDASQTSGFETGFKNSESRSVAGQLAKSAAKSKSIASSVAASQSQLESASRAAQEIQSAGGKTEFNSDTLGAVMNDEGYKTGQMALTHAISTLQGVGDKYGNEAELMQSFDKNVAHGEKLGLKGDVLAGFAAIATANGMRNQGAASEYIARLSGQSGLASSSAVLASSIAKENAAVGANTNLGGNVAAVGGARSTIGTDAGATGAPPTASGLTAELSSVSQAAEAQAGVSGMGDYSPATSAEVYADDKAIAESGLGTAQKLAMAKKAGMDPMPTSQIKPMIAAATKNDQMEVTKWLEEHPDEDAAAAVVALGLKGAAAASALAGARSAAKAADGAKPGADAGDGTPPPPANSDSPFARDAQALKDAEHGDLGKAAQELGKNAELPGGEGGGEGLPGGVPDDIPLG
ncbi:hypothetical protein HMI48_10275 [Acidithiobacillus ferrooxidans]|uniref:conjugal transfer protein TraG N-terminal domain-containing protein n=1 Tax=Acidithiobacillus ferrooxidans TaxID=920 RepID=UPI001C07C507|nr:conjugal transfer protein TraG N-terminal domain-containing protein [Acidithiobacillus ferrooxidans]MBU2774249.1 hypothetical protein [Acidithiobacillus ferrooxidans]